MSKPVRSKAQQLNGKLKYAAQCLREARRVAEDADFDLEEREFIADTIAKVRRAVTTFEASLTTSKGK